MIMWARFLRLPLTTKTNLKQQEVAMPDNELVMENQRLRMQLELARGQLEEINRMATRYGAPYGGNVASRIKYLLDLIL